MTARKLYFIIAFSLLILAPVSFIIIAKPIEDDGFYRSPYKVWAHRGYLGKTQNIAENTVPAYQNAIDHNAKGIEIDILCSSLLHLFLVPNDKPERRLYLDTINAWRI